MKKMIILASFLIALSASKANAAYYYCNSSSINYYNYLVYNETIISNGFLRKEDCRIEENQAIKTGHFCNPTSSLGAYVYDYWYITNVNEIIVSERLNDFFSCSEELIFRFLKQ